MRLKNLLPLLILLAACSVPPAETLTGTEAGQPAGGGSPFQPTATSRVLTIISPLNNAIVGEALINLKGNVSRDATMTVNNDIYLLTAGDFSIPLTLEEGPNALEIVASDSDGNETDLVLVLTYQP